MYYFITCYLGQHERGYHSEPGFRDGRVTRTAQRCFGQGNVLALSILLQSQVQVYHYVITKVWAEIILDIET